MSTINCVGSGCKADSMIARILAKDAEITTLRADVQRLDHVCGLALDYLRGNPSCGGLQLIAAIDAARGTTRNVTPAEGAALRGAVLRGATMVSKGRFATKGMT